MSYCTFNIVITYISKGKWYNSRNWTTDELRDVRSVVEIKDDGENSSYLSKLNYKKIYHQLNTKEI
jgi:hypothetical protein